MGPIFYWPFIEIFKTYNFCMTLKIWWKLCFEDTSKCSPLCQIKFSKSQKQKGGNTSHVKLSKNILSISVFYKIPFYEEKNKTKQNKKKIKTKKHSYRFGIRDIFYTKILLK